MKIRKEEITRELIWECADVGSIPSGWIKEVYYSPERQELYAVLTMPGAYIVPAEGHIYIDSFISLDEFWREYPYSREEAGVEDERDIENVYYAVWFDEFKYPKEL